MKYHFTDEDISSVPQWLAEEMINLNLAEYYLYGTRQFMILGLIITIAAVVVALTTTQYIFVIALYLLSFLCNYVARYYHRKVAKVLSRAKRI